ncbi:MAG: IS4 family transposase [Planctomycetes bacterium]|nr:IS4 family transposase [Planctomycetota bacterium]
MRLQASSFGEVNFGNAELGDARRTRRLVQTANMMQRRPGGSLPQKIRNPKDLRAFYRLMNSEGVTHKAILEAHRTTVLENIEKMDSPVLVLHDATELDYTTHRSLEDLGQISKGYHRGYIAQNSLAVDPCTREVIGLLQQVLHHRVHVPEKEGTAQKRERESRESLLWLKGTEPLPASWQLIDVCDQGADTFEFLEHESNSKRRFVIRSAYNRGILVGHGDAATCESSCLRDYAAELPETGTWTLRVTSKVEVKASKKKEKKKTKKRKARTAKMAVAFAPVQIKSPVQKRGHHGNEPLSMWVVRVWEVDPPQGEERLEWFLLTNEPVETFEDAYRVVGWYECRWIVEEYHKGMKTGCKIESPQFTTEEGLKPTIALLSIVTLTLLNMRDASRRPDAKRRKATELISADYVMVLSGWRHGKSKPDWSVYDFFYALARLGGHQNRKSDHPPGWQTIWEGWKELQAMVCGADVMKSMERCGKT